MRPWCVSEAVSFGFKAVNPTTSQPSSVARFMLELSPEQRLNPKPKPPLPLSLSLSQPLEPRALNPYSPFATGLNPLNHKPLLPTEAMHLALVRLQRGIEFAAALVEASVRLS